MSKSEPLAYYFLRRSGRSIKCIGVKVFKNWPSKICGRQPLKKFNWYGLQADHINSIFLKAVFHKFYLVRSWTTWPKDSSLFRCSYNLMMNCTFSCLNFSMQRIKSAFNVQLRWTLLMLTHFMPLFSFHTQLDKKYHGKYPRIHKPTWVLKGNVKKGNTSRWRCSYNSFKNYQTDRNGNAWNLSFQTTNALNSKMNLKTY